MRLEGKIAFVTGAAGDIGCATAKLFAKEGAWVILSDINKAGCKRILKKIEKKSGKGGFGSYRQI